MSITLSKHCEVCKEVIKYGNHVSLLPTMSLRICSVMGIGLAASGDMYFVKMLTASLSIPTNRKVVQKLHIRTGINYNTHIQYASM